MTAEQMTFPSDIAHEQGFLLSERFLPAGTSYPLHWHNFIEFEIIVSGSARHIYNSTTYTVNTGSAYMMYYYDFHSITATTDVRLYSIHFDKNLLASELLPYLEFNKFRCQFDAGETAYITSQLLQLQKEEQGNLPFQKTVIKSILTAIVVALIRKTTGTDNYSAPIPLQQAIAYINNHFREDLTLKQLAGQLSFSPNYLGQLFKRQMDCTFNDYLNTLRLKYACSLLSTSKLSVKEVSFAAGYQSVQYFLYVFKEKMGMTPGEYRARNIDAAAGHLKYHSGKSDTPGFYSY